MADFRGNSNVSNYIFVQFEGILPLHFYALANNRTRKTEISILININALL